MIGKIIKFLVFLVVLAVLGLIGFAYLGDLSPDQSETREQTTIEVN